jgi:hypothetical protein
MLPQAHFFIQDELSNKLNFKAASNKEEFNNEHFFFQDEMNI